MSTVQVKRWSREDYERMIEAGIFAPGERVELIDGEILEMSPQKSPHSTGVSLTAETLRVAFGEGYHVRTRMLLALDPYSEPEPDIAVVRGSPRDYRDAHPSSALLVVEIADSTLTFGGFLLMVRRCGVLPQYGNFLYGLGWRDVSRFTLVRCSAARALCTVCAAASALAVSAVRWPILRPGRGTSLP
jgi:hypothetical protein